MPSDDVVNSAWQRVQLARHPKRPYTLDYIRALTTDFIELHGDRRMGDDGAVVGGLARFEGRTVVIIGHQKGRDTKENLERNFGMPRPEGFRKAQRLMGQAAKFGFPLLTFIDTPGASPDPQAEERGQAEAIAESLLALAQLPVPIIATIIGEGNSGGAIALALADRILMQEHAYFSVVSPEGCAAILWRDGSFAPQAAAALRITAPDLIALEVIDAVIPEPPGGAHLDPKAAIETVGQAVLKELVALEKVATPELLACRHARYRRLGQFREP